MTATQSTSRSTTIDIRTLRRVLPFEAFDGFLYNYVCRYDIYRHIRLYLPAPRPYTVPSPTRSHHIYENVRILLLACGGIYHRSYIY